MSSGRIIGRNEFLRCKVCLVREPVADLPQHVQNLLAYFGAPKCPHCKSAKMIWERYTVFQLPHQRHEPPVATEP